MAQKPVYLDEGLSFEERAKDLVSRMTLEEKTSQMLHSSAAIPRLGIPSYNWWGEALHGIARAGVATMFPQAIAMAATFCEDLILKTADIISTEGRAKFHEFQRKGDHGIYKGLTFWSPNINIFRDPRWGRGHETYGEDPYLTGRLGVAFIKGLQGDHPKYLKAAACAKHYAVHSGPEAERHSFNAIANQKDMWETYLPAFKECVQEADVEAVMGAYNRTNGEPCCGSKTLLQDILRDKWGFKGHVVSDCWAIKDFHEFHHVTSTAPESVALALNNGCDVNCGNMYYNLLIAYEEGLVTEEAIDRAVTRLMITRMKLGLFDSEESVPYASIPYELNDCKEHKEFALEMSKKSIVLLKNEDKILPIDKNTLKSIAVIGPNADSRAALIGNYFGTASEYVTVLEGIREAINEDTRIYYAEGCPIYNEKASVLGEKYDRFAEAISAAERSDLVVMCLGLDADLEGEEGDTGNEFASGDKPNLDLPGLQQELLERIHKTGKPIILVLLSGSALAVNWADENIPAIIQGWYPGSQGGRAIASLIFGDYSPSGRLPVTFYRSTEELPDFRDYSMENRTYRYMKQEALYPFGYGLSYSKFEYSNLSLDQTNIDLGQDVNVSVVVKNVGNYEADEVVQLYLKDVEASVRVPNWELKGVKRISLKPGEEVKLDFTVTARQMALIDNDGRCVLEPGLFELFVGGSQPDSRSEKLTGQKVLKAEFTVSGEAKEIDY
ncbi:MAG: glycoside hydrolase family 3 protein [Clostridiales bacterium]|jgi:beta-glucosidase|nr:glycoside hydrolase family 3 C-terminal domain-containing protein [Bacillota bacterium]NLH59595.1 glycoside hydrolase family 3 protein [Clostridiales bacterium]